MSDTTRARRLAFAIVPLSAAALLVPGVAMASAGTTSTTTNAVMTGCLQNGSLTSVAQAKKPLKKCKTGSVKVSWNTQGAKGATGAQGPKGDKGDSGVQGLTGLQGLQGLQGAKGDKGDKGDSGLPGLTGLTGLQGLAGQDGVSGYQVVQKVVGTDLTGTVGGFGNPVNIVCPAGKSALSGGVVPSAASLSSLNSLLGGLLLTATGVLNTVTSVAGGLPVALPAGGGDAFQMLTPVTAHTGDTFYAVCMTATSAVG